MKGNTQFPQVPLLEEGIVVDTGDGDGVGGGDGAELVDGEGEGAAVEPEVLFHTPAYGGHVFMSGIF